MQGLPNSTPTLLFRKVVQILQNDGPLSRAVCEWKTFTERDGKSGTADARGKATVSLFPYIYPNQGRFTPSSDRLPLAIAVTMSFDSSDAGDYLDLWLAVQRAIFPVDRAARDAIIRQLQELGSLSEPVFRSPTPDATNAPASQRWECTGTILLEDVEITRNPS